MKLAFRQTGGFHEKVAYDFLIRGSALEACLAQALERMDLALNMLDAQRVSPQSHASRGVVQVAAAPIALAPIVLVAAGVTILVGVTIYVATEAIDVASESNRCRQVKEKCIDHCSGLAGLPAPGGGRFRGCMRECMEAQGCSY